MRNTEPLIRMLAQAQHFAGSNDWHTMASARVMLEPGDAFAEGEDANLKFPESGQESLK